MTNPIPVSLIVGDTFTLTDYSRYTDTKSHPGQAGTVTAVNDIVYVFTWPDGQESCLHIGECLSDWVIKS